MCDSIVIEFRQEQSVKIQNSDGSVYGHQCSATLEAGIQPHPVRNPLRFCQLQSYSANRCHKYTGTPINFTYQR